MRHKLGKKYIIPDALSKLASANYASHDNLYFELDAFFTYYTTLVEISPKLTICILNGYLSNSW